MSGAGVSYPGAAESSLDEWNGGRVVALGVGGALSAAARAAVEGA